MSSMTRILRRTTLAAAVGACALLTPPAAPAQAADRAPTSARLSHDEGVARVKVRSDRAACERDRLVVFYIDPVDGPSEAGGVRTNQRGVARIPVSGDFRLGAVVPQTKACGYAQTRIVRIDEPLPE